MLVLRVVGEGESAEVNTKRKPSARARRERIKIDAIVSILDLIQRRVDEGEVRIFEHRPAELEYFDRRDESPTVLCSGARNNWIVRGWLVDVQEMDAYTLVRELNKKKSAAVYRWNEIKREGKLVKSVRMRTVIVFHSKLGYAIVAETSEQTESLEP